MAESMHIGIALELHYEYARAILRGIISYARPASPWIFHIPDSTPKKSAAATLDRLQGVIGPLVFKQITTPPPHRNTAAVNISNRHANPGVTRVGTDDRGI